MNKIESINKAISIIMSSDEVEFTESIQIQETLNFCKEIIKKNKKKDTTSTKYKSKAMTDWRNSWFGKEDKIR